MVGGGIRSVHRCLPGVLRREALWMDTAMTTPQTPVSREQQVIETFVRKYFDDDDVLFIVNNDWNYQFRKFTESDEYRSIPPATDDLREKIEKTIIDKNIINNFFCPQPSSYYCNQ